VRFLWRPGSLPNARRTTPRGLLSTTLFIALFASFIQSRFSRDLGPPNESLKLGLKLLIIRVMIIIGEQALWSIVSVAELEEPDHDDESVGRTGER